MSRKSDDLHDIAELLRNRNGSTTGSTAKSVSSILATFDADVAIAEDQVRKATNDVERRRAQDELAHQVHRRTTAKMVVAENQRVNTGRSSSRFGPGTTELFASGLSTLPDDPTLKGV